jgi:C4-dicarboxylate transporter DctM subunit
MSATVSAEWHPPATPLRHRLAALSRWFHAGEDALLCTAMGALVFLGMAQLGAWSKLGFSLDVGGLDGLARHMTLLIGMLGSMAAAREGRLLAIGTLAQALPGRIKPAVSAAVGAVSASIASGLAVAAWQFVSFERDAGLQLAWGIPVWIVQLALPAGFAMLALRLWLRSASTLRGRALTLALAAALAWSFSHPPVPAQELLLPALVLLACVTLLGAPIFAVFGGASLLLFGAHGDPIASIPLDHYDQVTSPLLATLPLFTLAGYVLAGTRAARRVVTVLMAWTGHLRGGPAIVTVLACAFFTAFTGGSGVTILALGGLVMPLLLAAKHDERGALGLIAGAGSLGVLLPPCLPLVMYSIIGQVSLNDMFLAGLLPGAMLMALMAGWGLRQSPATRAGRGFDRRHAWRAGWDARFELLLPLVPLVLLFGGFALPVPAAAATAVFAVATGAVFHRDLSLASLRRILVDCGIMTGGVLLILGTAMGFTNYLITLHVPDELASWIGAQVESKWAFLLLLNLFLIGVGCLMDIFTAIVVVVPLVLPVAIGFGVDPLHLGILILANLELGYLTPPVGLNLFLAAYRFNRPVMTIARAAIAPMLVLLAGVLLITFWPPLTLWLPSLFTPG